MCADSFSVYLRVDSIQIPLEFLLGKFLWNSYVEIPLEFISDYADFPFFSKLNIWK